MKCLFLYNPNSGKGKIKKKLALIARTLGKKYEEVTVYATKSAEDLEEQVRRGAEEYDAIVFAGGDGTFNHVVHGLGERKVQLGYLPMGTANDVARSLGIPKRVKGALNVILHGKSAEVDCMHINGTRYAMYVAAAGAFTHVTYTTPQARKRRFGWAAYAAEGIKDGFHFRSFNVTIDCDGQTRTERCALVLVMNGRSVAGFSVNKRASMQDGVLEVALVKQSPKRRGKLAALFGIAHLFLFSYRIPKRRITFLRGSRVRVEVEEDVVWDFDGEEGLAGSIDVQPLPRHIKLFVPNSCKA